MQKGYFFGESRKLHFENSGNFFSDAKEYKHRWPSGKTKTAQDMNIKFSKKKIFKRIQSETDMELQKSITQV